MQAKYLIVIAIIGIVVLAGFNMFSSSQNEQDRAAMALKTSTTEINTTGIAETYVEEPVAATEQAVTDQPITEKPLAEQPKAIVDKATTQIDEAQQAELARAIQVEEAQ